MDGHDDIIVSLLSTHFGKRSEEDRRLILRNGRPTPIVFCVQAEKNKNRNFKSSWYGRYSWLCGSSHKNSLFCWPCLLVSVKKNVWNTEGFHDWKNLSRSLERHWTAKDHIQNVISVKQLSKQAFTILEQINEQEKRERIEYNANITKNREVFKRLIDLTCLLCKQEWPFYGHDESGDSLNHGNYKEMFDVMLNCNEELKFHWQKLGAFSGMSKTIQNDLIDCVREEMESVVYNNIKSAQFFSIQVDETTDITEKSQCSVICRFVDKNGHIREHFLGFYDVSAGRSAEAICQLLVKILEKFDFRNKLVAQTFDGASVMSSELNGLQAKIRMHAQHAIFTHCFAHSLNLVLQHSCYNVSSVKIFFATLQGIPAFFHKSSKRTSVLDQIVGKRIPTNSEARLNSIAKLVIAILTERDKLIEVFEELMNSNDTTEKTVCQAEGYKNKLSEFSFVFYLCIFKDIFIKTEILSNMLQKKSIDIQMCTRQISICRIFIQDMRNDKKFQEYVNRTQAELGTDFQTSSSAAICKYRKNFFEIIDIISSQINVRFSKIDSLEFLQLGDSSQFANYQKRFPEKALISLTSTYECFFDKNCLRNELETIYAKENENLFFDIQTDIILKRIVEHDLCDTLPQAYKLFSLIATILTTTASVERSFSCLKRVKTYVRNVMSQGQLSNLGLISIEKELLADLMDNKSLWYENIIKQYAARKNPRIDLLYK